MIDSCVVVNCKRLGSTCEIHVLQCVPNSLPLLPFICWQGGRGEILRHLVPATARPPSHNQGHGRKKYRQTPAGAEWESKNRLDKGKDEYCFMSNWTQQNWNTVVLERDIVFPKHNPREIYYL